MPFTLHEEKPIYKHQWICKISIFFAKPATFLIFITLLIVPLPILACDVDFFNEIFFWII